MYIRWIQQQLTLDYTNQSFQNIVGSAETTKMLISKGIVLKPFVADLWS